MSAAPHLAEQIWRNAAPVPVAPVLSVLTPVFNTNATPLIAGLSRARGIDRAELILLDDGSPDRSATTHIKNAARDLSLSVSLIEGRANVGRAAARNRLIAAARAGHVLLLDADMIPDGDDFLDRWIALVDQHDPAVAFGGFTVSQVERCPETALHRFVSLRSDCKSAAERALDPAQFTTTSNLLVRKGVFDAIGFDEAFAGWGWEDVEWALRVHAVHPIMHVDITATHAGLDDEATLLRKAEQGRANYARLVAKHPDAVRAFRSYRAARAARSLPFIRRLRPALKALVHWRVAPLPARNAAYKLFRILTYADGLS